LNRLSNIRIPIELNSLSETLLVCLRSRAWAASREVPLVDDPESIRIMESLDYDFRRIDVMLPEDIKLAGALRARTLDGKLRLFLDRHPRATIVNLGAGIDTISHRVDNGELNWIDVDTPEVIALRSRLLAPGARVRALSYSITDERWMGEIGSGENGLMFVACASLPYLSEANARRMIGQMAARFAGAEFIFDAYSPLQVRLQNAFIRYVGMSRMSWGLKDARAISGWNANVELVDQRPVFQGVTIASPWSLRSRLLAPVYARIGFWRIVHLRFVHPV
jgi:O-methyltransferase involved in polyketide biosynthesis